ncbi:hypothetical protein AVEN_202084-1 [Araneus ventricosus]|uniref:Uncharacterized protein n=1 Tax=Araneus ventricosus TaxID=182803 RepID=A0A4Y1ZT14_ARAVE|nr:hypothetical protein AVEN_269515-1 [Araneus ventricosus]GBL66667.1 hypothetical protein AVEN_65071-1 [Araneus ventricosus]GBL66705.1 hypothetical protein AVEN_146688-1 [Araneus ventricosus]GBL66718.1 hypothetical protein AVEN_202084-1 [Araneus ventricosus]
MGRGGVVVRSQPRGRRPPGSKPYSTEDLPCMWACCTLKNTYEAKRPVAGVVRHLKRGCQLRRRPRHLTVVQNSEVHPKITLVLLQNETLI